MTEIVAKRERGSRNGRGESGEEGNPSGHEAPGGAEGSGEIDVFAAGTGEIDPKLGVTNGAQKRADCSYDPDADHQGGGAEVACKESRGGEDAGPDHVG